MGKKSRHVRDESDPLLGFYSQNLSATSSIRNASNPLYSTIPLADPGYGYPTTVNGSGSGDEGNNHEQTPKLSPLRASMQNLNSSIRKNIFSSDHSMGHSSDGELRKPTEKRNGYRVHRVSYTAQNHVQVLFQMYGSAFPNVLPFVILNVSWTFLVEYLKRNDILDLTFHSSVGHSFMGLLVSFLIVSRSKISYDRFMEFRRHLATTYRTCREIAQSTTVFTFTTQTPAAKEWRQEVCYRTILLLRVTMDALLWSSTEREQWTEEYFDLQEIQDHEDDEDVEEHMDVRRQVISEHFFRFRKLSHGRRSRIDENFRAPITMGHILKFTIMQHPDALGYKMPVNEYRDLVNFVTIFLDAFHGFRVLVFTPYPFPLVQMTRAFLFFWVYTLPLVLLKDYRMWSSIVIVCCVSFGFIGIEYVSMALDDPFGDDTNDVDEHGMALLVYEDIYLAIYRTDGPAAAFQLRERVLARYKQGRGLDCYRDDLKGYSIWEPLHTQSMTLNYRQPHAKDTAPSQSLSSRPDVTLSRPENMESSSPRPPRHKKQ